LSDKASSEKMSDKGSKSQPPSVVGESIAEEEEDRKSQKSERSKSEGVCLKIKVESLS
jgi:hypothetical protein